MKLALVTDGDNFVDVEANPQCIELAAAAANKAARVLPPSAVFGGEGGIAVGEAVIVSGASFELEVGYSLDEDMSQIVVLQVKTSE